MKQQKMLLLFIVIVILYLEKTDEKCLSCSICNAETNICDQCLNGYKSTNTFPSNCYKCDGTGNYFLFNFQQTPPNCTFVSSCDQAGLSDPKTVYETNECVEECPSNYFLFNSFCYKGSCPPDTELVTENFTTSTECKCSYKYVYDTTKKKYTCLSKDEPCPPSNPVYNGTSLECLPYTSIRDTSASLVRVIITKGIMNYQILSECNEDEFLKINSTEGFSECVKECKFTELPYHYKNDSRCIEKCDAGDYEYEKERVCYKKAEECPTKYNILQKTSTDPHKCVDYEYCTDSSTPFYYEPTNTCLDNCSNIINLNTNVPTSPIFELLELAVQDSSKLIKKCVTQCPPEKPYADNFEYGKYRCVERCGMNGERIYTVNNTCYDNCSMVDGFEYMTIDTRECVKECPDGYFTSANSTDKICYKTCLYLSTYNYHYNNTCVTNETCQFYVDDDGSHLCYDSCPNTAPYYNFGTSRCFSSDIGCTDPKNDPTFIFRESNDTFVCESQCNNSNSFFTEDFFCLPSGNCTDLYPYEFNNICYKNKCPIDNMKYTTDETGLKKCYFAGNCSDSEYIQDGECVTSCNMINFPYFIEPESGESGHCFKTIEDCYKSNYLFVNESRHCLRNCSKGYAIQNQPGTFHPYERDAGTCLSECPPDYPYSANNICYKNGCPSGYYAQNNSESGVFVCETSCVNSNNYIYDKKMCVKNCTDTSDPFHINGVNGDPNVCYKKCPEDKPYYYGADYECLSDCGGASYYDPDTKECFKNCSEAVNQVKIFAIEAGAGVNNPCMASCPPGYFYQVNASNLLCISSCPDGYYHSSKNNQICVPQCEIDEKVGYNNACVKKCPDYYYFSKNGDDSPLLTICTDDCFIQGKNESGTTIQYNYVVNSTKQCVDACPSTEPSMYENVCYEKCPQAKPYYYEPNDNNITCYASCPDAAPYHNDLNKCLPNCTFPFNYHIENSFICLNACPKEYPVQDQSDTVNNITICRKICPSGLVNEDNICVTSCNTTGNGYKPFYDPTTNSCVSKCPNSMPFYSPGTTGTFFECKSVCGSSEYVLSTNECVSQCTENYNFIGRGNVCKTKCEDSDGKYYTNTSTSIYQCVESCSKAPGNNNLRVDGDFNCVDECPSSHPYKSPQNICYSICNVNKIYSYSLVKANGDHVCALQCEGENSYYLEDKVCINETACLSLGRLINQYGQCVFQCDQNTIYKYNLDGVCSSSCNSTMSKYSEKDYKCVEKCEAPNNFVRNKKICDTSCDTKSLSVFAYKATGETEYQCVESCPTGSFYEEGSYNCTTCDGYVVANTKKCIHTCKDLSGYYFYIYDSSDTSATYKYDACVKSCMETNKPFTLENGTCTDIPCIQSSVTHLYFRESDKICLEKCPENYVSDQNNTCITKCNANQFLLPTGKCADACDNNTLYKYYVPGENECLKKCPDNYYNYDFECVKLCNDTKKFVNNGDCVEQCLGEKKYYIESYTHGEVSLQQICLSDCVPEYPFLIINSSLTPTQYQCVGNCPGYHIKNRDPTIIAKECKTDCDNDTPFIGNDDECLSKCPDDKPFYIPSTDNPPKNQVCFGKCNQTAPYHLSINNTNECVSECSTDAINFSDLACIERCDKKQFWSNDTDINGKTKTFCLDQCNNVYGLFSTPDFQCVPNCTNGNYSADYDNLKCECINLYKINEENGHIECYDSEVLSCLNNTDEFIYLQENTKRCLKHCPTTVSPLGVCLTTPECPANSRLILSDGEKKCVCNYKFYRDGLGQLNCLGKDENCMDEFGYLVLETQECVRSCSGNFSKVFYNYCLQECPENAQETDGVCSCKKHWYIDQKKVNKENEYEFICMKDSDVCPENFPLGNNFTSECVARCSGTNYIYFNDQCLQSCENTENPSYMVPIDKESPLFNFSNYTCQCKHLWYYEMDNKNIKCFGSSEVAKCTDIQEYNYKYMIKDSKRCVALCPDDHPYVFNSLCFKNCDKEGMVYGYKLEIDQNTKDNSVKKCKCVNPFKRNANNEMECETQPYCTAKTTSNFSSDYLLINSTNECIEAQKCPESHPLLFNGICYDLNLTANTDECPLNSHYSSLFSSQCTCDDLWYKVNVSYKGDIQDTFCIEKSKKECPKEYLTLIDTTRECKKEQCTDIDPNYFEFNNICYASCPNGTLKSEDGKTCICNKYQGFWVEEVTDRVTYKCALEKCPDTRPMHINGEKQCVQTCADKKGPNGEIYYSLDDVCYLKRDCPAQSNPNDTTFECQYRQLEDASNLTQLYTFVNEDILRLYQKHVKVGGFLYKAYNTSLQIYALNKNGNIGSQEEVLRSNLSYISLESCINQIYTDNDMLDSDNIIVVKYDLLNITDKYMMNPVEYEFYSSRTGKKIDATVCSSYSIKISYPISYVSNKYDDYSSGSLINNFKNKFNRGKELNRKDSEVDTFNSNSSLYYDLCYSCEIEGKDLVLRNRINYLYPNVSLCENNCTYSKTDFELERVFCNCSLKKEFDFHRDYKISNFNFSSSEIDSLQKGPSNVASMTCLSKLSEVETISKNGAFYYSLFVLAGEITLCSLAVSIGFKSVTSVINSSFGNSTNNDAQTNNALEEIRIQDPSSLPKSSPPPKSGVNNVENVNAANNNINSSENDRLNNNSKENNSKNISNINERNLESNNTDKNVIEFIPSEYVFLFFDLIDKGVVKQVPRNHIKFPIKPKTIRLLQKIENFNYADDLSEPYPESQNIVEITEPDRKEDYNKEYLYSKESAIESEVLNINDKGRRPSKSYMKSEKLEKPSEKSSEYISVKKGKKKRGISNKKQDELSEITEEGLTRSKNDQEKEMFMSEEILLRAIKRQARILRAPYEIACKNETTNIMILILAEIIDKIYLLRTLILTKMYEIFVVKASLYILYHILLLTVITLFFDIETIERIFNEDSFPDLGFYLLYGFLSNLIVWFVYKMLKCLLSNFRRINQLIKLQNEYEKTSNENLLRAIEDKKKKFASATKIQLIIYFIIQFALVLFCFCYLIMFCGVYTGTKKTVFKAYGITILEIIIIKLIYSLILVILRKASIEAKIKGLYSFYRFLETYFS